MFSSFLLESQMQRAWREPTTGISDWATATARVLRDCITALGGDSSAENPLDYRTVRAAATAGLLQPGLSVTEGTGEALVVHLLFQQGTGQPMRRPIDLRSLEGAIARVVPSLAALARIADGAAEGWAVHQKLFAGRLRLKTQLRRGLQLPPRWQLFFGIAPIFERVHGGRRYAVSKYSTGGQGRETKTTGPAVIWTRALFEIASDSAHQWQGASPYPELIELRKWSIAKSEGFAEHIDEAGRGYRNARSLMDKARAS